MAKRAALTLVAVLLVSALSQAAPLNLTQDFPDMAAFNVDISYTPRSDPDPLGDFIASGGPLQFTAVPPGFTLYPSGTYDLVATIDKTTGELDGGTLTITDGASPLLTVDLIGFGFVPDLSIGGSPGAPVFEFVGHATGGSLQPIFLGEGIGTILGGDPVFAGHFEADYEGRGSADTFRIIPEPASMSLLLAGALTLVVRRRRSKRQRR